MAKFTLAEKLAFPDHHLRLELKSPKASMQTPRFLIVPHMLLEKEKKR